MKIEPKVMKHKASGKLYNVYIYPTGGNRCYSRKDDGGSFGPIRSIKLEMLVEMMPDDLIERFYKEVV